MLVLNLLVTELIVASVGLPLEFVAATQFGWKMGETACKAFGFLLTFLGDLIYLLLNMLRRIGWWKGLFLKITKLLNYSTKLYPGLPALGTKTYPGLSGRYIGHADFRVTYTVYI